jgi:hypothetical protein
MADAYLFSSDHAGSYPPYLIVADQNSPCPGHPNGKSWVPFKAINLKDTTSVGDPATIAKALETDGYFISG